MFGKQHVGQVRFAFVHTGLTMHIEEKLTDERNDADVLLTSKLCDPHSASGGVSALSARTSGSAPSVQVCLITQGPSVLSCLKAGRRFNV